MQGVTTAIEQSSVSLWKKRIPLLCPWEVHAFGGVSSSIAEAYPNPTHPL